MFHRVISTLLTSNSIFKSGSELTVEPDSPSFSKVHLKIKKSSSLGAETMTSKSSRGQLVNNSRAEVCSYQPSV